MCTRWPKRSRAFRMVPEVEVMSTQLDQSRTVISCNTPKQLVSEIVTWIFNCTNVILLINKCSFVTMIHFLHDRYDKLSRIAFKFSHTCLLQNFSPRMLTYYLQFFACSFEASAALRRDSCREWWIYAIITHWLHRKICGVFLLSTWFVSYQIKKSSLSIHDFIVGFQSDCDKTEKEG